MTNRLAVIRSTRWLYAIEPCPHRRAAVYHLCTVLHRQIMGRAETCATTLSLAIQRVQCTCPPGTRAPLQPLLAVAGGKLASLGHHRFARWYKGLDL